MKRVLAVLSTVAALLAVPSLAGAGQPMFRPLDGSTWDRAQVQEWLEQKDTKKAGSILREVPRLTGAEEKASKRAHVAPSAVPRADIRPDAE